eukprot:1300129-Pleurochrysis_carterae.AAC.1
MSLPDVAIEHARELAQSNELVATHLLAAAGCSRIRSRIRARTPRGLRSPSIAHILAQTARALLAYSRRYCPQS